MICPNCESENCSFVSHTHTKSGSFCDGCCGFILLGPMGILCGLCGRDTTTKEFWVCNNCGCKFQQGLERKTNKSTSAAFQNQNYHINDMKFSPDAGKDCPQCGKKLNANGDCNFCGYKSQQGLEVKKEPNTIIVEEYSVSENTVDDTKSDSNDDRNCPNKENKSEQ